MVWRGGIQISFLLVASSCLLASCRGTSAVTASLSDLQTEADVESETLQQPFRTSASGLKYRVLASTDGEKPSADSTVTVHYRGWLDDGTEFDNSYERGKPQEFVLSEVIGGWTEGLQLIGEGGKIELEVPSELGYGPSGSLPDIPPNATLHFIIELVKVH